MWWRTIGMRWWGTGGPVSVGTRRIHPSHWRLTESRGLTRYFLALLALLLLFTTSVLIFVFASSSFPNKWRTRKGTFLLLAAPPTRWRNPRSDKRRTTKSGSQGLGFLWRFILVCAGCRAGWRVREPRWRWHAGERKRRIRRPHM